MGHVEAAQLLGPLRTGKLSLKSCLKASTNVRILPPPTQALPNRNPGEPKEIPQSEHKRAYQEAIKVCRVLTCKKCNKTYRSFLGYVFHLELCGKKEQETVSSCDICGKFYKIHSLQMHFKYMHLKADPPPSSAAPDDDEQDANQDEVERSSKKKAKPAKKSKDEPEILSGKRSRTKRYILFGGISCL